MTHLMHADGLSLVYRGGTRALDGADLTVDAGETVAVIGESGSGKTTLGMAVGRVLPMGAAPDQGSLTLDGADVFAASDTEIRSLRRDVLGFVFQNPMDALDPTMRIGRQLARAMARKTRKTDLLDLLARARLDDPERVLRAYPHALSGGMAQRVAIAMALARGPRLLIADEPTASLDASIRDQVMDTLAALSVEAGAALLILSHDLRLAARRADRIAVMYGGRVVEAGPAALVFAQPAHPYTAALTRAAAGTEGPQGRLAPIPGTPPTLHAPCPGCAFAPRCALAVERCRSERPLLRGIPTPGQDRLVLCHRAEDMLANPPDPMAMAGKTA
jgi:oligopeptide/dipeptide ABC transporter ATP-binding protein